MSDDLIGAQLGNYEIESALGHGGMARVYKARDTTLKRAVAIKVIEPSLSAEDRYRDRFEREAQSVAALEHPNIVPVYYFGKVENLYYLAMKFIEGEDLSTLMNRYAIAGEYLPSSDILRITEGIVAALDYAHRQGVIHRDVKPSNIMIDREGHPYLADFGLALNLSQGTIGDVLGTPHYVSPEQARSSAGAIPQSDIYSFGVVLYELFTGVVPFDDPSPTAVALQHITKDPPLPRALNPDLSPQLEKVILKAMSKKPEERYQSGRELLEALRSAVKDTEQAVNAVDRMAFPPLPAGMEAPPPRRPSMRPVAAEVRASLAQRESFHAAMPTAKVLPKPTSIRPDQPKADTTLERQPISYRPLLALGLVIVAVLGIVIVAALSRNNQPTSVAIIATETTATTLTNTPEVATELPTNTFAPTQEALLVATTEPSPTLTLVPPTLTPVSPTATFTTVPPTATDTSVPPSMTPIPATSIAVQSVPAAPTSAPADWLPVRFIYTADAFYWMNDSDRTISSKAFTFERVGGSERFEGSRFAYYSMEAGRCMQIMFADVGLSGCPESKRPNAFFTPTRSQGMDFWTGTEGQFRVLWNGVEIAICTIADGSCSAFMPSG